MDASFYVIVQQVAVLFIFIAVGFICTKCRIFTEKSIADLAKFVLYIVIPCVIINSFNREYDSSMLKGLGIAAGIAVVIHVFCIILAQIFIHDKNKSRECILRFATVFSNCGFMALPLQQAILGDAGVFYCASYIVVFNLFSWTYGLFIMSGSRKSFSIKMIVNPGVIGVILGGFLFVSPVKLPYVLNEALKGISALNTPVPMIIVGYYIAGISSLRVLKDLKLISALFLRLIVIPLVFLGAIKIAGFNDVIATSMLIAVSCPVAVNIAMFSTLYKRDSELAATSVAVSTLLSILTLPFIIVLSM
ncbi:MAG: AEC family transporter [Treponemataceae bacterium]|nr:AEC family transporter [Treponemataceae bacterium]